MIFPAALSTAWPEHNRFLLGDSEAMVKPEGFLFGFPNGGENAPNSFG
jgi:hypothetical protein